ncbi:MAG: MFS transporter, partial [Selenomonadales bacterium]|nr:MFS transporter [Selenomonadales bacterium]
GCFMAMYNFLPYVLVQEPYSFTQTQIGFVYAMYLVGSFASAYMGKKADICGHGKVLCASFLLAFVGVLLTLPSPLLLKMLGLAIFTFGFFGAHSSACSWVGLVCRGDKAQAVSLYLLCYYIGASLWGSLTGIPYQTFGWLGAVVMMCVILAVGGSVAYHLWRKIDCKA